jgi:hypothetical protein
MVGGALETEGFGHQIVSDGYAPNACQTVTTVLFLSAW